MSTKTTRFDVAEYLDDDETIAAYLNEAFESGDLKHIGRALGDVARARGMTEVAKQSGVKREALYRALSEDGHPKLETVLSVCKALGVQLGAKMADDKVAA